MTELEEKKQYAALLLKFKDPFKAALELFPHNTNRALRVANEWPNDPDVVKEQNGIRETGADLAALPSKVDLAWDIWRKMQGEYSNGVVIPPAPEDYAKLAKLYAEVRGYIEKPAAIVNNNNVIVPKAIEVPTHGTMEEWEGEAEKQQRELLSVSRSRH